ncbi:hypothetical protein YC2023_081784 [Brassica napus]
MPIKPLGAHSQEKKQTTCNQWIQYPQIKKLLKQGTHSKHRINKPIKPFNISTENEKGRD